MAPGDCPPRPKLRSALAGSNKHRAGLGAPLRTYMDPSAWRPRAAAVRFPSDIVLGTRPGVQFGVGRREWWIRQSSGFDEDSVLHL
jgi:hypothetical protein